MRNDAVHAMEAARTVESDGVGDAIPKLDFESTYGRVRDNGQIVLPQTVIRIQNGKVIERRSTWSCWMISRRPAR